MTAVPPDPEPANTTGLEPGGGVDPGSTPPDTGSTADVEERQAPPSSRFTPVAIAGLVAIAVFVLLFLVVAVVLVIQM